MIKQLLVLSFPVLNLFKKLQFDTIYQTYYYYSLESIQNLLKNLIYIFYLDKIIIHGELT